MKSSSKAILASVTSLGALASWRVTQEPRPEEDLGYDSDFETTVETIHTEDEVPLKLKRYVNRGGQPILLAPGYLANGFVFDLPHIDHNLAVFFANNGYDVWVSSFRGCGKEPYRCGINDWNHSIDHLAALDAPALIGGVTRATGKPPIWIGHSMGGMVLYMYLQGATIKETNGSFRVSCDPGLAAHRNKSILGGITIGSPPALYYGGKAWLGQLQNLPLFKTYTRGLIRCFHWLNNLFPMLPTDGISVFAARFPRTGRILARHGPVAAFIYNAENIYADVGYSVLKWVADNVSTRMTIQIMALSQDPDFKDYHGEHNYTENMQMITAPFFFISGSKDFAGPENIRVHGYEQVSSVLKQFKLYPGYGHTDLVMGKRVAQEVYPAILSWIEQLSERSGEISKAVSD